MPDDAAVPPPPVSGGELLPVSEEGGPPVPGVSRWSEARVFVALGNHLRRRMLFHIVRAPQGYTVQQMAGRVRRKRSITGKHLAVLHAAGLTAVDRSGRTARYALHAGLRAQPGHGEVLDLGFLTLRVPAL